MIRLTDAVFALTLFAVAGQAHVELEAVSPVREPVVEGRERIFRRQRTPAPVRKYQRPFGLKEGMTHTGSLQCSLSGQSLEVRRERVNERRRARGVGPPRE